jgi:hypothetical protein
LDRPITNGESTMRYALIVVQAGALALVCYGALVLMLVV